MVKPRPYIALRTPRSRTAAARDPNPSRSSLWRPNSLTTIAPATLSRSVIVVFIAALCSICSRVSPCRTRPTRFVGSRNSGSSARASKGSRHSRMNIATKVVARMMMFDTT